jgi:tRNA dimethylallyltransferase
VARPLVVLVGATASGKTELALQCARDFDRPLEIVGLDSRQLYRQLAVGTAKPTAQQRALVPHHLIDCIDLDAEFDAARYRAAVETLLPQLWRRGVVPLVVGGAGFYLRALSQGFHALESKPHELAQVRAELAALPADVLRERLRGIDPGFAERLHANDRYRIARALELHFLTGRRPSQLEAEFRPSPVLGCELWIHHLTLPRRLLHERIAARTAAWLNGAWQREVEELLAAGWSPSLPGLRVLGYPQVIALLRGELDAAQAHQRIVVASRRYARQQETWFRKCEVRARGDAIATALVTSLRAAAGSA